MSGKKEFNPFDYQSGTSFRAILSHDYFALIEEMHQKVSSDMLSFALDVGNYFYRAVFAERVIMTAMVCASGLQRSERLSADENEIVHDVQTLFNGTLEKETGIFGNVSDIACGMGVVYFNYLIDYRNRLDLDRFNWDYKKSQDFFAKWYGFAECVKASKFAWTLNHLIDELAKEQGFDNPERDINRDIYDIEAPNQTVAEEIWRVVWLAGFTVGMSKPWQGRMDVPTHFMLKSFAWEKEKLHRMVQLIGWHFPNVRIKMILPLKENLKGYSWYRNRLDISQKILIYSRSAMLSLLSKDNFTDPWPEFRRLAKLD